jgi:hypothetical protein
MYRDVIRFNIRTWLRPSAEHGEYGEEGEGEEGRTTSEATHKSCN